MLARCLVVSSLLAAFAPVAAAGDRQILTAAVDGDPVSLVPGTTTAPAVVVFLGTECPMARIYGERLQAIADSYADQGVRVIGVMSNRQDSVQDIRGYIAETGVQFPVVQDPGNRIADAFGATRTPEAFLLSGDLAVLYHGRIDNQYQPGTRRSQATRHELRDAIEQTLAGQEIALKETDFTGCLIGKVKRREPTVTTSLTFCREVSRILQNHCVECHRAGDIGPFALEDYDEVVGWGETILEVIDDGRMPPWHADPHVGQFSNARHMPQRDIERLREWVHGGMPRGDSADLPARREFTSGWRLPRKPDVVLEMSRQPFQVPASGTVEYQYFVVDPGFTEDTWVSAAEVIPGNRSVVHHSIVFIRPPDGARFRGVGWLSGYVPGQRLTTAPAGFARRVPAGSKLVFQMHYTPTGSPQSDLSRIGLVLADPENVTHEVLNVIGIDQEFEIPPGAAAHPVSGKVGWFPRDGLLLGCMPHMHLRGRSFELSARLKDSGDMPLLNVPRYDFNWQHFYMLEQPLDLSRVDSMSFTATFDNSDGNPFNPDPSEWVGWGDQTWEEMAVVFLEVAEPLQQQPDTASRRNEDPRVAAADERARERQVQQFVDDFFNRLDRDGDGFVKHSETPMVIRQFHFTRYDANHDLSITRDEVRRIAESRFR